MNQKLFYLLTMFILHMMTFVDSIIYFGPCPVISTEDSCDSSYVKFFLYTRSNKKKPQYVQVTEKGDNITSSNFKNKLKNKIIVHGYNADMNLGALVHLKDELIKKYNANIWMVDWSVLVPGPCYLTAVYNVRYAGKCLSGFIKRLKSLVNDNFDLHVLGFSLGGHVPANAAPYLKPYRIPRITGLDPALPLFVFGLISNKLDSEDGRFVDIVHTNALIEGQVKPIGHVDFYMNGGVLQPGCGSSYPTLGEISCSHQRSVEYFAESVNTKVGFWGWRCTNFFYYLTDRCVAVPPFVLMGENINKTLRGIFSVDTNGVSPFALGKQKNTYVITTLPMSIEYYFVY